MRFSISLPVLALSFFAADVAANPHGSPHAARRAHDSIARRAPGDVAVHHSKRFDNAKFTFYDVGLGACGNTNVASDFIVALNTPQYGDGYPGPNCFKQISISFGGRTTTAVIMDQCPGCPYGGLDMSRGLFQFFSSEDAGIIYGEWHFIDGSNTPATTTTPQPIPTPDPSPTSTTPTPTPSPSTPPPSTSSSSTSPADSPSPSSQPPQSFSSSSSINYSSGAASNLAIPTPSSIQDNAPHNLLAMNQAIVGVGGLIVAGAGAE